MATILIADDDAGMLDALGEAIRDIGHDIRAVRSGDAALAALNKEAIDAMFLDLRMPGMDGLEVLRRLHKQPNLPPVTVLTAYATASNTIEAMRLGAFDHLTKPIARADLVRVLNEMLALGSYAEHVANTPSQEELIGASDAMRAVQKTIGVLADAEATVLITGETGTGKELVARAIHQHGLRAHHPFVALNCAAIPADLIESELFGHVRGAFTGATSDRAGAFRQAERGTLFLDEIGDMDLATQTKILRALQEREVTPVGGKPVPVNVRVIAATHRNLRQRVAEGSFREDLFYRLYVVPIHLPPLRERIADIVPLAEHFLAGLGGKHLGADVAARLIAYGWPGNVRELRNAMERCAALARGNKIEASDLEFVAPANLSSIMLDWPEEPLPSAIARLEDLLIRRALDRSSGNRAETARLLGIHRQLLYSKIKRYGINVSEDKTHGVADPDVDGEGEK